VARYKGGCRYPLTWQGVTYDAGATFDAPESAARSWLTARYVTAVVEAKKKAAKAR
jgi:hypothetical protein